MICICSQRDWLIIAHVRASNQTIHFLHCKSQAPVVSSDSELEIDDRVRAAGFKGCFLVGLFNFTRAERVELKNYFGGQDS